MGLKVLPHRRAYWLKNEPFFYCGRITSSMSCKRFAAMSHCLHVYDDSYAPTNRNDPRYDKLVKVRWLIQDVENVI